ncbi:hypothetical protein LCGC14_1032780 [marine sediment metagenome]|uniref:Type II secretion system protein GspG C-terminal domain-containing protein n=1 Tax=marine sediment metagenome TaxID=412755 RepID=A0A0F9R068_9ZZZZ
MRLPKRVEKGFTLIELLIVVAILGVLAAVVIPNVTRFVGSGEEEAADTELHNIQLAVTSMMLENGITTIPNPVSAWTDDMAQFPDILSDNLTDGDLDGVFDKVADPDGLNYAYVAGDEGDLEGYRLYGHDMTADGNGPASATVGPTVNYVVAQITQNSYTVAADGTVTQQ